MWNKNIEKIKWPDFLHSEPFCQSEELSVIEKLWFISYYFLFCLVFNLGQTRVRKGANNQNQQNNDKRSFKTGVKQIYGS